ncbi:MAG: hypothetical protein RML84_05155 [Anaerolineae bacterium]|nr:hypothetical protein [Anaerolineae bacterium]
MRWIALLSSALLLSACAASPTPALEPTRTALPRATREAIAARPTPTFPPRPTPRLTPSPTPRPTPQPIAAPSITEDNVSRLAERYRLEAPLTTHLYVVTSRTLALFGGNTFELRDADTLEVIAQTPVLEEARMFRGGWYAISPDARFGAYLLPNGTLTVYDLVTSQRVRTLTVPEPSFDEASDFALTVDGRTAVLVAQRELYRVDLEDGSARELGIQLPPQTRTLRFSEDGERLAALLENGDVLVYSPLQSTAPLTLSGFFTQTAAAAAFSPDGTRFGASDGRSLVVWALDAPRPRVVRTFEDLGGRVFPTFDVSNRYLAINDGNSAYVYDLDAERVLARFRLNAGLVIASVAFDLDSERIYLVGTEELTAFRVSDGAVVQSAVRRPLMEPIFSADGNLLLSRGGLYPSAALAVHRAADGTLEGIAAHRRAVRRVVVDPRGALIAVQTEDGAVAVRRTSGDPVGTISQDEGTRRTPLCFGTQAPLLALLEASSTSEAAVAVWDVENGRRQRRIPLPADTLAVSACENARNLFAVATADALRVLDLRGEVLANAPLTPTQRVRALSVSADAKWVAAITEQSLLFFDVDNARVARALSLDQPAAGGRFVGGGADFVFGERSDRLRWVRVPDGEPVALEHAPGSVVSFEANREGTLLFTASMVPTEDTIESPINERAFVRGEFAVWSLRNGQLLRRIALRAPIWGLAVSPNGRQVALGELNNALSVWQVD